MGDSWHLSGLGVYVELKPCEPRSSLCIVRYCAVCASGDRAGRIRVAKERRPLDRPHKVPANRDGARRTRTADLLGAICPDPRRYGSPALFAWAWVISVLVDSLSLVAPLVARVSAKLDNARRARSELTGRAEELSLTTRGRSRVATPSPRWRSAGARSCRRARRGASRPSASPSRRGGRSLACHDRTECRRRAAIAPRRSPCRGRPDGCRALPRSRARDPPPRRPTRTGIRQRPARPARGATALVEPRCVDKPVPELFGRLLCLAPMVGEGLVVRVERGGHVELGVELVDADACRHVPGPAGRLRSRPASA